MREFSVLKDRILWFDGMSTIPSTEFIRYLKSGASTEGLCVDKLTPELEEFNQYRSSNPVVCKYSAEKIHAKWKLPKVYQSIDVNQWILSRFKEIALEEALNNEEIRNRLERINYELGIYHQRNMVTILKTLIYIFNTLQYKDVAWGPGRGSSTSSYVLYIIGTHDVDSVSFDIDFHDFIK